MVWPGENSSMRTSSANTPPSISAPRMPNRYMNPMRLWSSVVSQLLRPFDACQKSGSGLPGSAAVAVAVDMLGCSLLLLRSRRWCGLRRELALFLDELDQAEDL